MSIEDRVRAELRAEAESMRIPSGSMSEVRSRGVTRRRIRTVATLGVATATLAVILFGSIRFLSPPPSVGPVAEETTTVTSEPVTVETTPVPTTTLPPTTLPIAGPDRIVVAGQDGIVVVEGGEITDRIDVGPVMTALDDMAGGYVVQIGMSASSILHIASPAGELTELVAPGDNETLTLRDVVTIDERPSVVYTARLSGVAPEEGREDLRVLELRSGEDRLIAQIGGYESGASQVTFAQDMFVVTMNAEGYTWFDAYALDGTPITFAGNPRTEADSAEDFLVWVGVGSLAPDGETFAFVEGSPRSEAPFRLVVVDLPSGERLWESAIADTAREGSVTRLDWDGETGVVSLAGEPAVVVPSGSAVERMPVRGTAGTVDLLP